MASGTRIHNLDIPDPTDYEALFLRMSGLCQNILEEYRDQKPVCSIATASGTPQMQTVWFLLAQSGLVPATLLKITPPRFLRPGQKAVTEILLSLESFPRIILPSPETLDIAATYRRKDGNREAAARLRGIKPHTFRKRAKEKFGL